MQGRLTGQMDETREGLLGQQFLHGSEDFCQACLVLGLTAACGVHDREIDVLVFHALEAKDSCKHLRRNACTEAHKRQTRAQRQSGTQQVPNGSVDGCLNGIQHEVAVIYSSLGRDHSDALVKP